MKIYLGLILSVLLLATNGFAQTMTAEELTSSPRPRARPEPSQPQTQSAQPQAQGSDTFGSFLNDLTTFENPHLREDIPEPSLKPGAGSQPTESGLLRADDPELHPGNWEQRAYQVSGVTFLGPVSASHASRLTGAPIREVYVDRYPTSNTRTYNTYGLLNHVRHLNDAVFTAGWVSGQTSGLARADVGGAQGLVQAAGVALGMAQGALQDAIDNMKGMGVVQAAAIAEAEAAVKAAEEAKLLAEAALAAAEAQKAEDEAAENDGDDND